MYVVLQKENAKQMVYGGVELCVTNISMNNILFVRQKEGSHVLKAISAYNRFPE